MKRPCSRGADVYRRIKHAIRRCRTPAHAASLDRLHAYATDLDDNT